MTNEDIKDDVEEQQEEDDESGARANTHVDENKDATVHDSILYRAAQVGELNASSASSIQHKRRSKQQFDTGNEPEGGSSAQGESATEKKKTTNLFKNCRLKP